MFIAIVLIVIIVISVVILSALDSATTLPPADFGQSNPMMICPHCSEKGKTKTKIISTKKGVSGGKATAAVLTGGVSLLATGLSRKEASTQAHCTNCNNTWTF